MIVSVKDLIKLLKFANVQTKGLDKGKKVQLITDALLVGKDGQIRIEACPSNMLIYYDIGTDAVDSDGDNIPVSDIKDFIRFLAIFKGDIELSYSDKKILVTDSNIKAEFNTNKIINATVGLKQNEEKLHKNNVFMGYGILEVYNETYSIVDPSYIANVIKKASDSLGVYNHKFEITDEELFISTRKEGVGDIISNISSDNSGVDAYGTYSVGVDHVFNHFEDEVTLYLSINRPMVVSEGNNTVVLFPTEDKK